MLRSFDQVLDRAKGAKNPVFALVCADDASSLLALSGAKSRGIATARLFGNPDKINKIAKEHSANIGKMEIVPCTDENEAVFQAISSIKEGSSQILMKGNIKTSTFMKGILDREKGLRSGELLSHALIFECPLSQRLKIVTDGGINIAPSLENKAEIAKNAVILAQAMGIEKPRIAVLAAVEVVNPKMPETQEAEQLAQMGDKGLLGDCFVQGPLALDLAISEKAAQIKGIGGPVPGQADILLVPNIVAGNILGKSLIYFGNLKNGGIVLGAGAPIVFLSRADDENTKLYSIALGSAIGRP